MTSEHLNVLANFMMALAATAGAVAAFKGLNAWKSQSLWQSDNELARRVLIAIYRYRDTLYSVRHPVMANSEKQVEIESERKLSDGERRSQGVINAYVHRWERHYTKRNELDALLIETDAVWGIDLSKSVAAVKQLEQDLYAYIWLYLDANFRGNAQLAAQYKILLRTKRDILYDSLNEDDEYRKDFMRLLEPIECYLRTKLGRP